MMTTPVLSLLIFAVLVGLAYFLFRRKGPFWNWKMLMESNEKIIAEDILKSLSKSPKTTGELFDEVPSNLSTVEGILKEMEAKELIIKENQLYSLLPEGKEYAIRIIRAHRLWEKYLADETGFEHSDWHPLAEKAEHQLSDQDLDELALSLYDPYFDPHGDPIPTKSGEFQDMQVNSLLDFEAGETGVIVHLEDEPDAIYQEILKLKLHIGSTLKVLLKSSAKIVFESEGITRNIKPAIAKNISLQHALDEDSDLIRLSNLPIGKQATIIRLSKETRGQNRRRLLDLGFVRNADISVEFESPLRDPRTYKIKDTQIALRQSQAEKILVKAEPS